eukprot:COSAG04_NODE_20337_length_396_cov_0.521886_1_plen_131_part_11
MWSVPLLGWLADAKGRRWALFGAYTALLLYTLACAFATTPSWYLVARHFNGVGWGSQSLSAYVLGTEIAPRKTATAIKTYWAVFSSIGNILSALALRALLFLPVRSQTPSPPQPISPRPIHTNKTRPHLTT